MPNLPLIKANFWRIRKNILASLFKKTAEFFGSAKKSHDYHVVKFSKIYSGKSPLITVVNT